MFEIYKSDISFDYISLNENKILDYIKNDIWIDSLKIPEWKEDVFFIEENEKDIDFLFLINTINFSYWQDLGIDKWTVTYKNNIYSGSMALFAAFKKALLNGYPLLSPSYLKNISIEDLENILDGTSHIPMLGKRVSILNEIGKIMHENKISCFIDILKGANNSALKLISILDNLFPSFSDKVYFNNIMFPFYKRAQLISAMIYGRYQGKSYGNFYDIDRLTVFADYRVPQTLRKLGLIYYDEILAKKIENKVYLSYGSKDEMEIRISCIIASEMLKAKIYEKYNKQINSLQLDYFLWKEGKKVINPDYDFHRTRTIYY